MSVLAEMDSCLHMINSTVSTSTNVSTRLASMAIAITRSVHLSVNVKKDLNSLQMASPVKMLTSALMRLIVICVVIIVTTHTEGKH